MSLVPSAANPGPPDIGDDDVADGAPALALRLESAADHAWCVAVAAARCGEHRSAGMALQRFDALLAQARALVPRAPPAE